MAGDVASTVYTALPEREPEPDMDEEDMDARELPVLKVRDRVDAAAAGERPSPIVLLRSRTVMGTGVCVRRSVEESIEGLCERGAKDGWDQTWVSVSAQCVNPE